MVGLFEMQVRVGGDPRGFDEFTALRDELAKLSHPACPPTDWAYVERLCLALFQKNGAELQTAACFALARGQLQGLEGVVQGVALIEALAEEWPRLWPSEAAMRLDILVWLFAQLQLLLRRLETSTRSLAALIRLDAGLERLNETLDRQGLASFVARQLLRQQVGSLIRRLERNPSSGEIVVPPSRPESPSVIPLMILLGERTPDRPFPVPATRRRRLARWMLAAVALVVIGAGWLIAAQDNGLYRRATFYWSERTIPAPVRLDSLSLFDVGSVELRPDSTKVLIDALVGIKARPGWLIVITGHTDATGDAGQNLRLSQARAQAVRDWMQRMGDIPDDCFAVQGFAASQPVAGNDSEAGRAANRRVDIRLVAQPGACGQPSWG
ncbi:OmpA family protein [Pseudomonas gingeri]|uniref:OmpA family protein n=1 Tax=Pseudomonas gingeri TaxID=117681 RepID=A0A7Y7YF54_9PSED|nr:OmpA family protein [Pseudomonas gingeri]NWB27843.1 OmpA family protein [Pseudomonas gingeri]NWC35366.1 OmpA family protein [Pseudomonas gingeri]NWD46934.1 OmpA family protein [Pseudomonas gingeri]